MVTWVRTRKRSLILPPVWTAEASTYHNLWNRNGIVVNLFAAVTTDEFSTSRKMFQIVGSIVAGLLSAGSGKFDDRMNDVPPSVIFGDDMPQLHSMTTAKGLWNEVDMMNIELRRNAEIRCGILDFSRKIRRFNVSSQSLSLLRFCLVVFARVRRSLSVRYRCALGLVKSRDRYRPEAEVLPGVCGGCTPSQTGRAKGRTISSS